jgi:hypothetical protein
VQWIFGAGNPLSDFIGRLKQTKLNWVFKAGVDFSIMNYSVVFLTIVKGCAW